MSCAPNDFTLSGAVTICQDTSFTTLGNIKAHVHPAAPFHATTLAALTNTFANHATRANIIGFGAPGVLFTGAGSDRATNKSKYISIYDLTEVMAWVTGLKPATAVALVLCGCDVGAGTAGNTLLSTLAANLGIPVSAPSGFVFVDFSCHRLYLQEGAVWVTALPAAAPTVVPPPNPYPANDPTASIVLFNPAASVIPVQAVRQVRLGGSTWGLWPEFSNERAQAALPFLHLDRPYQASPATLAIVTGSISLDVAGIGRREFNILNGRMLQDAEFPSVYYHANLAALGLAFTIGSPGPLG